MLMCTLLNGGGESEKVYDNYGWPLIDQHNIFDSMCFHILLKTSIIL